MRISRAYEAGSEFKARQGAFGFAEVAFAVLEVVTAAKKALVGWWKKERPVVAQVKAKWHQLVLELDGIAQMPLFRG